MRYPYERFLRFLVTRKVALNQTLTTYGLSPVGDLWMIETGAALRDGAPASARSCLDHPDGKVVMRDGFIEWAHKHGIHELWQIQPEFDNSTTPIHIDRSFQIFINPYSRAMMGMLLLSRCTDAEICEIVGDKLDFKIDDAVLIFYRAMFWDIRMMGRASWETYLRRIPDGNERHYIAHGLASPNADMAKDIIGSPITSKPDDALREVMGVCLQRFREASGSPEPIGQDIKTWADLVMRAATGLKQASRNGAEEESVIPSDFNTMFSVTVTKSAHTSLSDLKGHIASPSDTRPGEKAKPAGEV